MKKFLSIAAGLLLSIAASAQSVPGPQIYTWTAATATGVVTPSLAQLTSVGSPANYTITVSVNGTVPSACTFEVESSEDAVHWSTGTTSLSGSQSCAAPTGTSIPYHFAFKPVSYIRIKVLTLTGADGTTGIVFTYTRSK